MIKFKIFTVMLVASLALLSFNSYAQDGDSPGKYKYAYCIEQAPQTDAYVMNYLDGASMQFAIIGSPGILIHGKEQATSYTAYQSKVENRPTEAKSIYKSWYSYCNRIYSA